MPQLQMLSALITSVASFFAARSPVAQLLAFTAAIFLSLDGLSPALFTSFNSLLGRSAIRDIPIRGDHLDALELKDEVCILLNKCVTVPFAAHFLWYLSTSPRIVWEVQALTVFNGPLHFVLLMVLYDLGYYSFHRVLHVKWLYPLIHKHHHRQHSPSRGNTDGLNAHPVEYIVSAYMHLWALQLLPGDTHILAAVAYQAAGAIIGSLNHTRLDVRVSVPIPTTFGYNSSNSDSDSDKNKQQQQQQQQQHSKSIITLFKAHNHDVHHRFPDNNFGQYCSVWDRLLGSYRPHEDSDL
jgi:sterol desaturase/sphingolipid hydroxylase (fatty acid hydroxylase superfamily)